MLERFLGKAEKTALSKNQIELICPLCSSVQKEPRLVQTTFCRSCGEHLRIEKGGRIVASALLNPAPSSGYRSPADDFSAVASSENETAVAIPRALPTRNGRIASLGGRLLDDSPHSGEKEVGKSAVPMPLGAHYLTRDQGGSRQHYFKEVECFSCRNRLKVGRSARSTTCPSCGDCICLEDVDIEANSTSSIRTRGDVVIRKTGNLEAAEVRCRDLKVYGTLSAAIECAGEFVVRATGTIIGEVRCRRLLIDRDCDVHFMNSIIAEEVEVRGRILGHIECLGAVTISASGFVHGDVTARSVSIEPGGQLDGAMNIVRATSARSAGPPSEAGLPRPSFPLNGL